MMVKLRLQTGSTLSNVDIIKLHLYFEGPSTPDELAAEVSKWMKSVSDLDLARERYVMPVLDNHLVFRRVNKKYEINLEELPEYQVVREIFEKTRKFLSEKDLKSKVAKQLEIKVYTVALDPARVPGLAQSGKRWGLDSWRMVNDEAYEVLLERKCSLSERELLKLVVESGVATEDDAIFDPVNDKRFMRERKSWRVLTEEEEKKKVESKKKQKEHGKVDQALEKDFISARTGRESEQPKRLQDLSKLKKVLIKKLVSDKLKESELEAEPPPPPTDSFFPPLSDLLDKEPAKITSQKDFDKVTSYQRVEDVPREVSLAPSDRESINDFLDRIARSKDLTPLSDFPIKIGGPLSAPKVERIIYHRYKNYSTERMLIPDEYNRLMIDLVKPRLSDLVLNPSFQVGGLSVAILNRLYEDMLGMYWALGDKDTLQLASQSCGTITLDAKDTPLIEKVKEEFVLTRNDLLENFIANNFCGIEADPILSQAGKIITRLSGFENVFIVTRDFLSELPEIFGQPPNPENDIDLVFDLIIGNLTFKGKHNIVANYLDQACRIIAPTGRIGFFLRWDFLMLMNGHEFLDAIMERNIFDVILKLTGMAGDAEAALIVLKPSTEEEKSPITFGVLGASTDIPGILKAFADPDHPSPLRTIPNQEFARIFDVS